MSRQNGTVKWFNETKGSPCLDEFPPRVSRSRSESFR